jgi:flagellar biosynthesis chaperone FliJ
MENLYRTKANYNNTHHLWKHIPTAIILSLWATQYTNNKNYINQNEVTIYKQQKLYKPKQSIYHAKDNNLVNYEEQGNIYESIMSELQNQ